MWMISSLLVVGHLLDQIKLNLCQAFDMTDLGFLHYCIGVEVWQTGSSIFIFQ